MTIQVYVDSDATGSEPGWGVFRDNDVEHPGPPQPALVVDSTTGQLAAGDYAYAATQVIGGIESRPSPLSEVVTADGTHTQVTLTVPIPDSSATAVKLYRTTVNGDRSTLALLDTITDFTPTYTDPITGAEQVDYADTTPDGSLGSAAPELGTWLFYISADGTYLYTATDLYEIWATVPLVGDEVTRLVGGGITIEGLSAIGNVGVLSLLVRGETEARIKLGGTGAPGGGARLEFGGGSSSPDVNLYRAAADVLGTDDSLSVGRQLLLTGDISPTQITSAQNDYNPTNLATASALRLTSDASRNITGLQGGADGRVITIHNVGSNNIVLKNQDAGSSAANRFAFGADVTLAADQSVTLRYDATSSRWRRI